MSSLSEKELLLLSNYVYIDDCTKYKTVGELIDSVKNEEGWIDPDRIDMLSYGGGMSCDECRKLLQSMDEAGDKFKSLNVERQLDQGSIRALCFVSPDDESHASVIFRGTGGAYEAWADNVRGEYLKDTDIQKMADDFIRYDCGVYDDITVSGHSKGGNLAGYVTITNRDRVRSCLAFDPQGYGKSFREAYGTKVRDASYNIKVVSADNDYVNSLLDQVAMERVFVKNKYDGLVGRHSSFALYDSCVFDSEGNIAEYTDVDPSMALLHGVTSLSALFMEALPGDGNEKVSELLASIAAAGLANDADKEYKKERIMESAGDLKDYGLSLFGIGREEKNEVSITCESLCADTDRMKSAIALFNEALTELKAVTARVTDLRYNLNYRAASRLAVEVTLKIQERRLEDETDKLSGHITALDRITGLIEGCEGKLTEMITGTSFAGQS